jgi:nucleoside-diphosphate-sugar epimerase
VDLLITGAAGFIGSALTRALRAAGQTAFRSATSGR